MNLGTARVVHGNALDLPLDDNTVDLVCTSPPYFGLRSYQDGGQHYSGQIGAEATPAEFVDALIAATREMMRVVKPSGSIWVNLGDKYSTAPAGNKVAQGIAAQRPNWAGAFEAQRGSNKGKVKFGVPNKSLTGIPWRYALRCIDDLGLILRAEVIWSKPNGLPESVTDRVRRSHEQWFHLTLNPRYYSAVDEIREEHLSVIGGPRRHAGSAFNASDKAGRGGDGSRHTDGNPLGKLPGSVWTIPTQPLTVPTELGIDHFAAFPMEWPRRIITGWSPLAVCSVCGEGRRPVTDKTVMVWRESPTIAGRQAPATARKPMSGTMLSPAETRITGYVCACTPRTSHRGEGDWKAGREVMPDHGSDDYSKPGNSVPRRPGGFGTKVPTSPGEWEYHLDGWEPPSTTPGVVLDPFGGTGTVALMAKALGRDGISVDLSRDYVRLAEWRTSDPGQLAAALQVDKPEPIAPDQLNLFEDTA